eukprot:PhF_6_TR29921/c0_g1_i1/m.43863
MTSIAAKPNMSYSQPQHDESDNMVYIKAAVGGIFAEAMRMARQRNLQIDMAEWKQAYDCALLDFQEAQGRGYPLHAVTSMIWSKLSALRMFNPQSVVTSKGLRYGDPKAAMEDQMERRTRMTQALNSIKHCK